MLEQLERGMCEIDNSVGTGAATDRPTLAAPNLACAYLSLE
jgi:hypothetical protein